MTVRIVGVNKTGFVVEVQEFMYLDQWHAYEGVSYLAIEPGVYTLSDGRLLVAAYIDNVTVDSWGCAAFPVNFTKKPVLLVAVVNKTVVRSGEELTVIVRVKDLTTSGFCVKLDLEKEQRGKIHAWARVAYVTVEPGVGLELEAEFVWVNSQAEA